MMLFCIRLLTQKMTYLLQKDINTLERWVNKWKTTFIIFKNANLLESLIRKRLFFELGLCHLCQHNFEHNRLKHQALCQQNGTIFKIFN